MVPEQFLGVLLFQYSNFMARFPFLILIVFDFPRRKICWFSHFLWKDSVAAIEKTKVTGIIGWEVSAERGKIVFIKSASVDLAGELLMARIRPFPYKIQRRRHDSTLSNNFFFLRRPHRQQQTFDIYSKQIERRRFKTVKRSRTPAKKSICDCF